MRIPMVAFVESGDARVIAIAVVLAVLVCGIGSVHAATGATDEFNVVMDAAIAANGAQTLISPTTLETAIIANDDTTPLVLDVRPGHEYDTGHINGSINIYYRHLGKSDAQDYLNSSLEAHIAAGKKNEIVTYGNTRHLSRMVSIYLKTQGYTAKALRKGFSEWTSDTPEIFKECTSFNSTTGKGNTTQTPGCTSNNFSIELLPATDASTQSGEGYMNLDNIAGAVTSADLAEIIRAAYDARFGNMSKPGYRMSAAELYDLLDDNGDGDIANETTGDDLSNDPFVLSNRGSDWDSNPGGGPYYAVGHIPGAIGIDTSDGTYKKELRILNDTDFMPTNRTIVHHCWVGVSQHYGATWYNFLGYDVVSLDWGIQGWTIDGTVRGFPDIVVTPQDITYETGDNQTPYVVLKSPSPNEDIATTTVTFSVFVLEGGSPNVTLWGNWSGGWGVKAYNDTAEDITDYSFTVANFSIGTTWKWGVNVTDEYNNSNWTANWTFNIIADVVPPNVTISLPANGSYVSNSTPTLSAAMVEDNPDTMWYSVDGGANKTGCSYECASNTFTAVLNSSPLPDGLHNVTVYANDTGGLENSNISFFTVDITDPTKPALISPADNIITADATPDLNWTSVTDINFANYTIEVDNSLAFDSINYTYNTTNINESNYSVTTEWAEDTWYWRVVAWDKAGNSNTSDPYTLPLGYGNSSINITANETITIDALNETGTILEIFTSGNVTGGYINIIRRDEAPANPLNSTNGMVSGESAEKYITINVSDNIRGNLSWVKLRIYYTTADLDRNGGNIGSGDINENTLKLYWNNVTNGSWHPLSDGENYTGSGGPYVNKTGVNTTSESGYRGYIWANITNFSVYGVGGSLIPEPIFSRIEGGGSLPPKKILARAVLTTADDWRYAMMAAGFAAANDYILIVIPTHSIDLPTRNNMKWFDELIIVGDSFVISDGIEDEFIKLRRTLVPGFAKLNTTRVKGANFFGTAVQLVKRWKDPKGIIVVRGDVFADALVAGQLSAATDSPILYTMPGEIWPPALNTIKRLKLDVTIVGGEKAVSKKVEDAIKAAGVNVRRVGGKDRYETAALIGDEYIKAAKGKGKDIDTITFLSGKKGEWASTLGFRSYVYNSTILYIKDTDGQSAVPTPTKNFIAAHPYISSASIVIKDGAKPKGYEDVDAYIKDMEFDVDPTVHTFIMDVDPDKKDYTLDTSTGGLSTTVSQIVIESLGASGVLSGPSADGGGGGVDGGGGQ